MSSSAGTLFTTHNATFIPPRLMPGYKGYCPSLKFDYGETYGSATAKYFQDYRSQTLQSSNSPYAKGGQFPGHYTHLPDLVIANRSRSRDQYKVKSLLTNLDHDREEELNEFNRLSHAHRDYYTDKSGEKNSVTAFVIPNVHGGRFQPFPAQPQRRNFLPEIAHLRRADKVMKRRPSNVRDRAMRDVYFERR